MMAPIKMTAVPASKIGLMRLRLRASDVELPGDSRPPPGRASSLGFGPGSLVMRSIRFMERFYGHSAVHYGDLAIPATIAPGRLKLSGHAIAQDCLLDEQARRSAWQ